ncbi:hypothetical protein FJV41_37045 [Myxococcus llanfairpwllgwyngyllgogerychwyrndrobwllllantysiliogogogochensis]|uniref:Uncharacterized protein n=2 Tax=Myxococcus llanfairpwllgwyngyllgogerychwyrndrobwllllantysiliogogogochensis TaxID=2590453 RepID=A0A540WPJ0_9BACT|nr:hypothetical protein FJV41_37045 [Myxococcus llanfairpwllgwyngyllgogerychwyrndrobwllllantysiliogogogochensis]
MGRRAMHGRQAALVMMLAGLWACGGEDAVTREGFGGEVVQALCARAERCGEYAHASACEEDMRRWGRDAYLGLGTRYDESLRNGQLRFDEGAARRCLDSIRGGSCDTPALSDDSWRFGIEYDATCRVLVASASSESCQSNLECGEQGYCGHVSENACAGVCQARGTEGSVIPQRTPCEPGLVLVGLPWTCLRPLEEGASCVVQEAGGASSLPCAEGLWCDRNGYKTCKRVGSEGDICENQGYYPCGPSLVCSDNKCVRHAKEGSACTAPTRDGTTGLHVDVCQRELFCDANPDDLGLCRPRREERQECRLDSECAEGLLCKDARLEVGRLGVCVKAVAPGEACDYENLICPQGHACAVTESGLLCLPIAREGEPCGRLSSTCDTGSRCVGQRCISIEAALCQ